MDPYTRHLRWSQLKVSVVITVGLIVLFFGIMFAGSITSWFQDRTTIRAIFQNAHGLQPDAPVRLSGIEIGTVQSLTLKGPDEVLVTMSVAKDKTQFLRTDSVAVISTLGLFGDKFVELKPGSPSSGQLRPDGTIRGTAQVGFEELSRSVERNMVELAELTARVDAFVVALTEGDGTIPKLIKDPSLYNSLSLTAKRLKAITDNLEQGKGSLGQLLKDDKLYRSITNMVQEMEGYAKTLNSSQGTLNKLVTDPALYEKMAQAANRLDGVLSRLERGQGTLGNMLQNDEVWVELRTTIREFSALLEDVKKNPRKYFKFSVF